jgi:hypothetical protein
MGRFTRGFLWPLHEKIALAVLLPTALGLVEWVKISQIYLLLGWVVYLSMARKMAANVAVPGRERSFGFGVCGHAYWREGRQQV